MAFQRQILVTLLFPVTIVFVPVAVSHANGSGSKVGFIGLGNMGGSMAENLLQKVRK